jgi:predicted O-linked N-acetylglucosamine transferase (SPINDLY family)
VGRPAGADLRRPTFASRMAGSLLRAVDLPQLITTSFADYEELAVELANNPHASPR